jgi:hypothetical protein
LGFLTQTRASLYKYAALIRFQMPSHHDTNSLVKCHRILLVTSSISQLPTLYAQSFWCAFTYCFRHVDSTTGTWLVRLHNLSHLWNLILPVVFLGTSVFFNLGCLPGCPFASNFQRSAIIVLDKTLHIQTMFIAYFNFAI